jgi:DMSO reductase anchor subunit
MDNRFIHMIPLLLFTSMAIVAAGLMTGLTLLTVIGFKSSQYGHYLFLSFVLAGLGTLISLFHLGRKERFLRALLGINHSWLSREVLVAGIFAALSGTIFLLYKILPPPDYPSLLSNIITGAAVISGILLTWTIGLVYNLPSRPTWQGLPNFSAPLVTALLTGSYCFILLTGFPGFKWAALILWAVDFSIAIWRFVIFHKLKSQPPRFVFPHLSTLTQITHIFRLLLSLSIPVLTFISINVPILLILSTTILLDRLALYSGSIQFTPKSEIATLKSERMQEAIAKCSLNN